MSTGEHDDHDDDDEHGDDVTTISPDAVGPAGPGVYVVHSPDVGDRPTVLAQRAPLMGVIWSLTDHGWRPVALDSGVVDDKSALIDALATGLGAPEWFGHNWDALVDVLRDRADQQPLAIVVAARVDGGHIAVAPRNLEILADIVGELITEGSQLKLVRVVDGAAHVRDV